MNDKFDELARGLAQSVTRRAALKKFGVGLAGMALATLGLANNAEAAKPPYSCKCNKANWGCDPQNDACMGTCYIRCSTKGGGGGGSY